MFTGIIEESMGVKQISKRGGRLTVLVGADKVLDKTKIGDSIAVDGICLTVEELFPDSFSATVMGETSATTTIKWLSVFQTRQYRHGLLRSDKSKSNHDQAPNWNQPVKIR